MLTELNKGVPVEDAQVDEVCLRVCCIHVFMQVPDTEAVCCAHEDTD